MFGLLRQGNELDVFELVLAFSWVVHLGGSVVFTAHVHHVLGIGKSLDFYPASFLGVALMRRYFESLFVPLNHVEFLYCREIRISFNFQLHFLSFPKAEIVALAQICDKFFSNVDGKIDEVELGIINTKLNC